MPNARDAHDLLGCIRSSADELLEALVATKGPDWSETPLASFVAQTKITALKEIRDKAQQWQAELRSRLGAVDLSDLT